MVTKKRLIISSAILFAVVLLLIYYYMCDPSTAISFKCPFKLISGYDCPSCGIQRALHACLHGHFAEAARLNFFLILAIPYAIIVLLAEFGPKKIATKLAKVAFHKYTIYTYIALYLIWWVVRNILGI